MPMADQPTGDEMLERFKTTLGKLLRVPKDEVLRMEGAAKAKRRRQRTRAAPRRKAV
jgi:hypothetical protein